MAPLSTIFVLDTDIKLWPWQEMQRSLSQLPTQDNATREAWFLRPIVH